MGKKLADGAHTRQATSPPGEPHSEAAWSQGNYTSHKGYTFTWDPGQLLYKARIPPNANPPSEFVYLEFTEAESYDEWTAHQYGSDLWTATGTDYFNGG